jgi:hypothetical protein
MTSFDRTHQYFHCLGTCQINGYKPTMKGPGDMKFIMTGKVGKNIHKKGKSAIFSSVDETLVEQFVSNFLVKIRDT